VVRGKPPPMYVIIVESDALNLSIASATNEMRALPGSAGVRLGGFMHPSHPLAACSAALFLIPATMPQLAQARELIGFSDPYSNGTVVVKTSERALYYVLGNGKAVRYPVGSMRRRR
jgi:lipoprotein-anchoring transpeptidase ErfK/SrfK